MNAPEINRAVWDRILSGKTRIPHAILLYGPAGVLKAEFGRALAKALLCESLQPGNQACEHCASCNWFSLGNHPDFRWLKPESFDAGTGDKTPLKDSGKDKLGREITIDQVRELADFLNLGTHRSGQRLVLITPAEAMNRNTANAILKSLEEPRPGTLFILVSDQPEQLLPTIRSRCMGYAFQIPEPSEAIRWLEEQGVTNALKWLNRAGGAPRIALEIANGSQGRLLQLLERSLCAGNKFDAINLAAEIDLLLRSEKSLIPGDVIDWTQKWIADATSAYHRLPARYFPDLEPLLISVFKDVLPSKLFEFNNKSNKYKKLSQHTLNNRLFFEEFYYMYSEIFAGERS